MAVIAMTREMATRGKDVATGLAERLDLTIVHSELVEHDIAEHSGMRESEVHRFLEGEASLLDRWKIDPRRLSRYTAEEIFELAAKGRVLIRGWGANYLLRNVTHVIGVRICAPMSFREQVLMERLGINERAKARHEIERNDAAHNGAVQKMFGIDWADVSLYAIVLNTARVSVEDCVEQIVHLAECPIFQETPEARAALLDKVIEARVGSALARRFGSGALAKGFEATVSAGKVTLTGASTDELLIVDAIRLVHTVEGVTGVESKIVHVDFHPAGGF